MDSLWEGANKGMKQMNIGVIGLGNMGQALVLGWLKSGVLNKANLRISTKMGSPALKFANDKNVNVVEDNRGVAAKSDLVWICVKPQQISEVLMEIREELKNKLLVSVAAGVKIKTISHLLGNGRHEIVRVMPNTPLLVGGGMSGWVFNQHVAKKRLMMTRKLLGAVGEEMEFSREEDLEAVTAISGSGPAYFFATVEALIQAGRKLGLTVAQAQKLVNQTFIGSAAMLAETGQSAEELREMVTSKGGTTEAALKVLRERKLAYVWLLAVRAAQRRARELSKN